jgi:hypothetical protein
MIVREAAMRFGAAEEINAVIRAASWRGELNERRRAPGEVGLALSSN